MVVMQMYAYALIIWLLSVRCIEVPIASVGPGGSSFSLVASWEDADLAAFVDVNTDRRTDAIVLSSENPPKFYALLAPNPKRTDGSFEQVELFDLKDFPQLQSIAVADFNGDSLADYLFVAYDGANYHAGVRYAGNDTFQYLTVFATQPVVCDANADMMADVYGELKKGDRVVFLGGKDGLQLFSTDPSPNKWSNLSVAGFSPLASDTNPSFVILTDAGIEVFANLALRDGELGQPAYHVYQLPQALKGSQRIGKLVFGDFDMSNVIRLLIIGCKDILCQESLIYTHLLTPGSDWENVFVEWTPPNADGAWSLALASTLDFSSASVIGPSLGDVDLDGYPDLAVGLQYRSSPNSNPMVFPAILRNLAGTDGSIKFKAYLLPGVGIPSDVSLKQIAFFDYNEDGIFDLFISTKGKTGVETSLYMQKPTKEAYFLKVMLTTGLCGGSSSCPNGVLPYGLPGYGFRASYETQGADSRRIRSGGAFVTSSCCGALQLPFTTFGFGDFATYIETVPVSVPAPAHQTRTHELTFIVPNAQVVVVPYPYTDPSSWQAKLFLQPLYDMKVMYVAITLLVTCVILIIVIGVLQYLEVRSDQKERMQESQRFHFDAM